MAVRPLALVVALACAPAALCAEPRVSIVPLDFAVTEFRGPSSRLASVLATSDALRANRTASGQPLVAVWGKGGAAALTLAGAELRALPLGEGVEQIAASEVARGAIPQSRLQSAGPLTAFLSDPTRDYDHGVLGDGIEAGSVTIAERQRVQPGPDPKPVPVQTTKVPAGPDAVFEDLEPRLVELERNAPPHILVVKSYRDRGSALAVIGKRDGAWAVLAETPPLGAPQRWLNPAAAADFDGDGRIEIALVKTPHIEGVLQVWAWDGAKLALKHEAPGYSNHAQGATALDLAAAFDLDGDGVPELAIPTLDRKSLAVLSLKGGIKELWRIPLPAPARTGLAALGSGRDAHLLVGLEDGRLADVRP